MRKSEVKKLNLFKLILIILIIIFIISFIFKNNNYNVEFKNHLNFQNLKKEIEDKIDMHNKINAKSYLVYEEDGKNIYTYRINKKITPASLSKLFTVDYILELFKLNDKVLVENEISLIPSDSSKANIIKNKEYTIEELIIGTILPSGNDAALTLAKAGGRKIARNKNLKEKEAINYFMKSLNKRIKDMGCLNTYLENPDGYSYNSYTTAKDIKIIVDKLMKNKFIEKIVKKEEIIINDRKYINVNPFKSNKLYKGKHSDKNILGIKTGSLNKIYNIVLKYNYNNKNYIIIVLNSPNTEYRIKNSLVSINKIKERMG